MVRTEFKKRHTPELTGRALGHDDIPAILALQDRIAKRTRIKDRDHIPQARTAAQLQTFLDAGMTIAGVCDGDTVAGYCLLTFPEHKDAEMISHYPLEDPENTVLIQAFMLDPHYLRYDLFTGLYDTAFSLAAETGRQHIIANTMTTNHRVLTGLGRMGFETYAEGPNAKGRPAYFMRKNLG